jgi:hypothetical protein
MTQFAFLTQYIISSECSSWSFAVLFFRMDSKRIVVIFIDEKKGKQKDSKKEHHQTAQPRLPMNQISNQNQPQTAMK